MRRALVLVVGLVVAGVCVRLGIWQLQRLEERKERNRQAERQFALPPLPLDQSSAERIAADPDAHRFRAVVATGRFDLDRELVVIARAHHGVPGVYVVTPLVIGDTLAVLVERGWLPSPDGRTVDSVPVPRESPATVAGVLLRASGRPASAGAGEAWPRPVLAADPVVVGAWYPYTLVPLLLRQTSPPPAGSLLAVDLPERSDGPHLSYAVQWFTFATIALVGAAILFARSTGGADRDAPFPGPG